MLGQRIRIAAAALLLLLLASSGAMALPAYIDAQSGIIVGRGEAHLSVNGDYNDAREKAIEKARESVNNILLRQPVDPDSMEQTTVGEYLRSHPEMESVLKSFIDSAKIFKEAQKEDNVEVTILLPVEGADGYRIMLARLMGKVVPARKPTLLDEGEEREINSLAGRSSDEIKEPYRLIIGNVLNASGAIGPTLGEAFRDRLAQKFIGNRKYDIYTGRQADELLSDAGIDESSLWGADPAEKISVGGVDGIVLVSIESYDPVVNTHGIGSTGYVESKVDVVLDLRILNSRTGRWVFLNRVTARVSDKVFSLNSADDAEGLLKLNDLSDPKGMASRSIDEAVKQTESVIRTAFPLEGYVLKAMGDKVYVSLTRADGIEVGDILDVYRTGEMLTDPVTGEEIDYIRDRLGSVKVTEVRDTYSQASTAEIPIDPFAPGDIVSLK